MYMHIHVYIKHVVTLLVSNGFISSNSESLLHRLFYIASVKVTGVFEHVTYTGVVGKEIKRQTKNVKGE